MATLAFGQESFKGCKRLTLDRWVAMGLSPAGLFSLRSIVFGEDSFGGMDQLSLLDFKALTTITFEKSALIVLEQLDLGGMPNLETILARNRSCYRVKTLELTRG